jgi:hypothetical protein
MLISFAHPAPHLFFSDVTGRRNEMIYGWS